MSYKLEKPYSKKDRLKFIVEYNHNQGLKIEETSAALYALLPNEVMNDDFPVIDPDYEKKISVINREKKLIEIHTQINNIDIKRIRALCEPEIKDELTGETWLAYYTAQIHELREEIQRLEKENKNDITE